ncbi:DUF4328 domain-containing protein [Kitasatospora sp. NPDC059795]|uniref:DUF4328 domain-containing protein n=1 Tax=Kitasatospora sp. NPDC059795 TaxID=3346949 RepID=UPI00365C0A91
MALAAQVLIGLETALQLVLAAAGGTRSALFRAVVPLSALLFFGSVAVFLVWFRRCRLNAELLAPGTHRYSLGWAVGAWFTPVALLWIPRTVTLDIWRASSPAGTGVWLVNAWWAAWLAKTVGGVIVGEIGHNAYGYSAFDTAAGLAAAVLAVLLIRRLTAHQEAALRG